MTKMQPVRNNNYHDVNVLTLRRIARMLAVGARMLEDATSASAFLMAIEANVTVWKFIQRRAEDEGRSILFVSPGSLVERLFGAKRGFSDQDVTAIISLNRQVSSRLQSRRASR